MILILLGGFVPALQKSAVGALKDIFIIIFSTQSSVPPKLSSTERNGKF